MTDNQNEICEAALEGDVLATQCVVERLKVVEQQLANSQKREVILRGVLDQLLDDMGEFGHCVCRAAKIQAQEALAATADLDGFVLCEKEPVVHALMIDDDLRAWRYDKTGGYEPLFRAAKDQGR